MNAQGVNGKLMEDAQRSSSGLRNILAALSGGLDQWIRSAR
jgi:hypothetical protein